MLPNLENVTVDSFYFFWIFQITVAKKFHFDNKFALEVGKSIRNKLMQARDKGNISLLRFKSIRDYPENVTSQQHFGCINKGYYTSVCVFVLMSMYVPMCTFVCLQMYVCIWGTVLWVIVWGYCYGFSWGWGWVAVSCSPYGMPGEAPRSFNISNPSMIISI